LLLRCGNCRTGEATILDNLDDTPTSLTIGPRHENPRQLTSIAPTTTEAVAAALSGLLAIYRDEAEEPEGETSIALAFRAEGADVPTMVRGLGEALLADIDHESYDVRAAQFNGYVRTDVGYAGWGYALATEGRREGSTLTILDIEVQTSLHRTTVKMSVFRHD
jgi:hypothetical protein